jgi:hypothetical protein
MNLILSRRKELFGGAIDVEITVIQCKCRGKLQYLLSFGFLDEYYWEEIDKKYIRLLLPVAPELKQENQMVTMTPQKSRDPKI